MENLCCAVAGKTVFELPFGMDEGHPNCIALKLRLTNRIGELHIYGVTDFYCNCEYGVGLWAAEIVTAMKNTTDIRLNVVMPYENQASRYSNEVRDRFFYLHSKANSVVILHTQYCEDCYRDADIYMVDNSDVLLVDDFSSFIARYAAGRGMRVVGI